VASRFLVFILVIAAILSLAAFYVGSRLIALSPWAASRSELVWLTLALFVALQFLGPLLYRVVPDRYNRLFILHWASYTALGVFGCLVLYTAAADLFATAWSIALGSNRALEIESAAVGAMVLVTLVIGSAQVALGPRIYTVPVPLTALPPELEGFRIVQVTDVHLGPTIGRRFMEHCVAMANALDADVVALTGDFVDGPVAQLREAVAPLAGLKARGGVFFVTGNHEYYWNARAWIDEFRALGLRVLVNEHVVIRRGDAALVVAGITDASAGPMLRGHAPDPQRALAGAPDGAAKVLLAHHPASHAAAERAGFDLQISGHTHGGQFFPFSLLVRLANRHYKGLYRLGRLWLYVSRGTGYWGPPLRFGVPAEITVLRLQSAAQPRS
jgi:predicted MPP superfamily phosphohydrolase